MSRRRIFVSPEMIRDSAAILPAEQVHYLRDVLRLRSGDVAEVFDGAGGNYSGTLRFSRGEARIDSLEPMECVREPESALILAQALIKSDKFELVLQKATELGVSEIQPLATHYSDVRIGEGKIEARRERWQKIVREASRQCGRAVVPEVGRPIAFPEFLHSNARKETARILFHEHSSRVWNPDRVPAGAAIVCIGPEGGWHPAEAAAAANSGFMVFSLGPRVLRAETAAIAALVLVQFRIANSRPATENGTG